LLAIWLLVCGVKRIENACALETLVLSDMGPVLATDLDGTFIPLDDAKEQHDALAEFHAAVDSGGLGLVYVTGRHTESVLRVVEEQSLPRPNWIICDVGTTILANSPSGFQLVCGYRDFVAQRVDGQLASAMGEIITPNEDLVLQEKEKQGLFKLSFYCCQSQVEEHAERLDRQLANLALPYRATYSIDPFNGDGLIDLLPQGIDKAGALRWWMQSNSLRWDHVVFAGDSGNDFAALTSGLRAILVGNAAPELRDRVRKHHHLSATLDRLYLARNRATAGVLEGCRWFQLIQ